MKLNTHPKIRQEIRLKRTFYILTIFFNFIFGEMIVGNQIISIFDLKIEIILTDFVLSWEWAQNQ